MEKKRKLDDLDRIDQQVAGIAYNYVPADDDHCETPVEAYQDIASVLQSVASTLNKTQESLAIYDPYFCEGSVIARLGSLGFGNVYNRNEDFYAKIVAKTTPDFDVIVTNPPYSGDNMEKLLDFCLSQGKAWFLLVPNYVYMKDYFSKTDRMKKDLFFIIPSQGRYLYSTPKGRRQSKSANYTSPFPTFWYCCIPGRKQQVLRGATLKDTAFIGHDVKCIPIRVAPDNDPRKKKLRNAEKRKKHKKRKKEKGPGES